MPPVGRPAVGLPDACCPDWGVAALPVPDVIEEMASRVLEDGGDVLVAGGGWSHTGEPAPPAGPASWVV
jgi:hypothetical protein